MPTPKYVVCRPCSPPRQLVRSPSLAGSDVTDPITGRCLFHPPLNERLYALPRVDAGGAKSMLPNRLPWSLSLLLETPPTVAGTAWLPRMPRNRLTESDDTPAACNPIGSVSRRL